MGDKLTAGFDAVDGNGDGQVSYFEALVALPDLSSATFNALDTNGDGQISRAEAGLDNGGGCAGCTGSKGGYSIDKMKKSFSDLFLAGLGLGVLSLLSRRRSS